MNKKYFYFKIKKDFFQLPEIKKLRKFSGGDTFLIIYFKIILLSLGSNGIVTHTGIEATVEEELALELDESVENVTGTISFLKSVKHIVTISEKKFKLTYIKNLVGSESESAARVRKFRDKQRNQAALHCNSDVTAMKRAGNKNVTPEYRVLEYIKDSLPLTPSLEGKDEREIFLKIKNLKTFKNYNNDKLLRLLCQKYSHEAFTEAEKLDKKEKRKFDDEPKIKDPGAYLIKIFSNFQK
ncbi:MAG: phage replisome organizer N-terminal domain-containing protein [bacterium]